MSKILINPQQRGMLPPNISINNNILDNMSFTNMSFKESDFAFIESYNGLLYYDIGNIENEDINNIIKHKDYFDYNVNMWIGCDVHDKYEYDNIGRIEEFKLKNPILMNNTYIRSDIMFNLNKIILPQGIIAHNIFTSNNMTPILILEHLGKGFEIISHNNILANIEENKELIYEVLIYCYLNSYKTTPDIKEWITTDVPDYEVISNRLKKKVAFISNFDINRFFGLKDSEIILYNVDIKEDYNRVYTIEPDIDLHSNVNNIMFIGMFGGKPMFEKNKDNSSKYNNELEKPKGWKSIYNKGKIQYVNNIHYCIETNLEDKVIISESDKTTSLNLRILPFKSTVLGLNKTMPIDIEIPFIIAENDYIKRIRIADYIIYLDVDNITKLCFKEDYTDSLGKILLTINIRQTPESVNITDMRSLGGGLLDEYEDNYNLLDIGHINGRPYRKAGSSVVTMPKKYEKFREQIENAINKAKVAEELVVVIFEDKNKGDE